MVDHIHGPANGGHRGDPESSDVSNRVAAAHAFIMRRFRTNPTLDDIARAAHFSSFHFHRLFRHRYGKTPKRLVVELQIAEVQRLATGGVMLKDAAVRAGFVHQSHMTWRFKQETGMTPGKWVRAAVAAGT